jgi:hypothetical protein
MSATAEAIRIVIYRWHHAPVPLDEYRRRRWLAKHARPMPPRDAA